MDNLKLLINNLRSTPDEKPWLEFKHNNYDPQMIGRDVAALANAAALAERNCAYMIWGIHDKSHEIIGTQYDLQSLKKGNQEIENWLRFLLSKNADFSFETADMEDKDGNSVKVGIITIAAACNTPIMFEHIEYIRVGSYTKKLNEFPQLQARLWDKLRGKDYETQTAKADCSLQDVVNLLQVDTYYSLIRKPMPLNLEAIEFDFIQDEFIKKEDSGVFSITNLGALLLAKHLTDFRHLERKAVRVIRHKGNDRLEMLKQQTFDSGYAVCFKNIENYLLALLPSEERIERDGVRRTVEVFPMQAIREAISNMCIHQDLTAKGVSLLVEIFDNRVEITNPGVLLVDAIRIIDTPPKSRNEKMAAIMRRFGLCEEAGSGWDKMVQACEQMLLPAPKITQYDDFTKVQIMSKVEFIRLSQEERIWATYTHTCLCYLNGQYMSNGTLRRRFGLNDVSAGNISRLIKKTVESGLIRAFDPSTSQKYMVYVPAWA